MREDGWYWVRLNPGAEWEPALYRGGDWLEWYVLDASGPWKSGEMEIGERIERDPDPRRTRACVDACKGISTDRLEKMVPGTLANLLAVKKP